MKYMNESQIFSVIILTNPLFLRLCIIWSKNLCGSLCLKLIHLLKWNVWRTCNVTSSSLQSKYLSEYQKYNFSKVCVTVTQQLVFCNDFNPEKAKKSSSVLSDGQIFWAACIVTYSSDSLFRCSPPGGQRSANGPVCVDCDLFIADLLSGDWETQLSQWNRAQM